MNCESPDEQSLVEGVMALGYTFIGKDAQEIVSIQRKYDGRILQYELLNTLEFDSSRKRMSVIVRDLQSQKIVLLCKGADSIMGDLLNQKSKLEDLDILQKYVDLYAEEGLRTLLLAKKDIEPKVYQEWHTWFQMASASVEERESKIESIQNQIECGLNLIGATAVEDRLQEDVKETIEAFKETEIKLWVLTGDKVETAINIGFSCGLLNNQMDQYVIKTYDK